jgi:hypothetical protein
LNLIQAKLRQCNVATLLLPGIFLELKNFSTWCSNCCFDAAREKLEKQSKNPAPPHPEVYLEKSLIAAATLHLHVNYRTKKWGTSSKAGIIFITDSVFRHGLANKY